LHLARFSVSRDYDLIGVELYFFVLAVLRH
jgi:hypothetical protein